MTTRYVNATKRMANSSFDSPIAPERSNGDALKVAIAGDFAVTSGVITRRPNRSLELSQADASISSTSRVQSTS